MTGSTPDGPGLTRGQFILAGAGLAAGLVGLSGCGDERASAQANFGTGTSYDGPPVELAFWNGFTGGDAPMMLALIDQFGKEHPNIKVRMVTVRWEDFYQKVPAATRSGVGPDVALMHVDQLSTSAAHGAILPLDELTSTLGLSENNFAEPVWNAGTYRGTRYGIPLDMHPLGLFINLQVLEKAGMDPDMVPETREEYEDALVELKSKGIQGDWVTPFLFTGGLRWQSLLYQFGGAMVNEDATEATWNSDAGVDALNWMVSLVKRGFSPRNVAQDADNIAFKNGQSAFIWQGIWGIGDYGSTEGLEWKAAPVPRIGSENAVWANSHNFVVMRRDSDPNRFQATKTFIESITRNSAAWAEAGQVPARKSARQSPTFQKLEAQVALAQQVPYMRFAAGVPGISDVRESTLDQAIAQAINGSKPVQAALDDSAKRATELLRLNREKYEAAA